MHIPKLLLLASAFVGTLAACTSGVDQNIGSNNATFTINSNVDATAQLRCIEEEMVKLPFRFQAEPTTEGWQVTTLVFGGAMVGWFPKSVAIRTGDTISYYMDAADFNMDAFGVRSAVEPILRTCS